MISHANEQNLSGIYTLRGGGETLTMSLDQDGTGHVTGLLERPDGHGYNVKGYFEDGDVEGELLGSAVTGEFDFYLDSDDARYYVEIDSDDFEDEIIYTVEPQPVLASVARQATAPQITAPQHPPGNAEYDPLLVGYWIYEDIMSSPDLGFVTVLAKQFQPDGVLIEGDAQTVMSSPVMPGYGGDPGIASKAFWRTEKGILYINPQGSQWVALGGYQVQGNSLFIQYHDGTSQLLQRR